MELARRTFEVVAARAREQQGIHPRVRRETRPDRSTRSLHHVEGAARQPAAVDQLGHGLPDAGGELRRLEHHRVAREQRGHRVKHGQEQRVGVRGDHTHHAHGLRITPRHRSAQDLRLECCDAVLGEMSNRRGGGFQLLLRLHTGLPHSG